MNAIQRLNYFTSQFLIENDFQDEQSYHRSMRLRHNEHLHTPGVVDGLQVSQVPNTVNQIKVSTGMAIDQNGQEIVLLADSDPVTLNGVNTDVFVTIQYTELLDVPDTTSGLKDQYRRTTEKYEIAGKTQLPQGETAIVLARVTLNSSGSIAQINNDIQERPSAGAKIAPKSISTAHIQDGAVTNAKMASNSVNTGQLLDNSVTAAKIVDGSVGRAELATGAVTADKIALNSFVVRSLRLDGPTLENRFFSNNINQPAKLAGIKITVPSAGMVIVTASGTCAALVLTPGNTAQYWLGLQPANQMQIPDDRLTSYMDMARPGTNMTTTQTFSFTKVFPVTTAGSQIFQLLGVLITSVPTEAMRNCLDRLTLTAMFVPCATDLSEGEG
ncbi:MAG: hypothetical protein NW224_08515 [Leptolyngbyaceae cyanobacterium bins.302]|nr:hypothetical protein [Leptolyngbyaceae cyanobacterium bins.302]